MSLKQYAWKDSYYSYLGRIRSNLWKNLKYMELKNCASFWLSPVQAITTLLFNKPFSWKTPVIKIKWKKSKAVYTWVRSSFQWSYCMRGYWIHQIDPRELVEAHVNIESYKVYFISNNMYWKESNTVHYKRLEDAS